ncbi:MAG: TolC family outer membrane protein [Betaproteobacteria bacterium]|nr:TolC family outer membrane protein [Betaproteobacteria bacterium]
MNVRACLPGLATLSIGVRKLNLRLLLPLLPVLLPSLSPLSASAMDLLEAYRDALNHDAQFASAKAGLDAGREKLPQGRAALLPVINLSANTLKNEVDYETRPSGGVLPINYQSNGWSVSLTQPLLRWQNWAGYKQSELAVAYAEAQYAIARQDLLVRVTQAYFDVLLAQETLATTQTQKSAIAEQLALTRQGQLIGTTSLTDTQEAQARFDLATAQEIAATNELLVRRRALKIITGKEAQQLKVLRPGVTMRRPQPDSIDTWATAAEQGSPVVQAAQAGFTMAEREVEKQRAGHLPTLDLVATRGHTAQQTTMVAGILYPGNDTSTTTVGLQLALPLFSGGSTNSRDREAAALREKARADLDNARRQAAQQALQAYLGITSGLAQVQALEQGLVSSQSALASNRMGYQVGMRANIDVLNAQQQVSSTQRDLAKARFDTLAAQVRLKAAAGSLADPDIAELNTLLE